MSSHAIMTIREATQSLSPESIRKTSSNIVMKSAKTSSNIVMKSAKEIGNGGDRIRKTSTGAMMSLQNVKVESGGVQRKLSRVY